MPLNHSIDQPAKVSDGEDGGQVNTGRQTQVLLVAANGVPPQQS